MNAGAAEEWDDKTDGAGAKHVLVPSGPISGASGGPGRQHYEYVIDVSG